MTKYRESERYSSSIYNQNDPWDPPIVFEEFLRNNENIEDEVPALPFSSPTLKQIPVQSQDPCPIPGFLPGPRIPAGPRIPVRSQDPCQVPGSLSSPRIPVQFQDPCPVPGSLPGPRIPVQSQDPCPVPGSLPRTLNPAQEAGLSCDRDAGWKPQRAGVRGQSREPAARWPGSRSWLLAL